MSKYDPLAAFLQLQHENESVMSFDQIELVLGSDLPAGARAPRWWANEASENTHPQRRAWSDAGFEAHLVKGLGHGAFCAGSTLGAMDRLNGAKAAQRAREVCAYVLAAHNGGAQCPFLRGVGPRP